MNKNVFFRFTVVLLTVFGFLTFSCVSAPEPAPAPVVNEPPPAAVVQEPAPRVQVAEEKEDINFRIDSEGNMRLIVTIVFRADASDFSGLSQTVAASNNASLDYAAEVLRKYSHYNILIEGNANPLSPAGAKRDREEPTLKRLSEQRAVRVSEELGRRGVSVDRKNVTGVGTIRPLFAYNDAENNWKNRRVEFILIKK